MQTKTFKILARSVDPIASDWQLQLATLLGAKPRRLSRWCELGLLGAVSCIRKTGATVLAHDVAIRVYSEYGTLNATQTAMAQASEHLPMPFTFMQTQPGQLFNALGAATGWQGDGYATSAENRRQSEIALLQGIRQSTLLAWVDEEPEPVSRWIWLEQMQMQTRIESGPDWQVVDCIFQPLDTARWLKITSDQFIYQAG